MTFILLALLPSILTMGAVCITVLALSLLSATTLPQDEPCYPEVDWLALDAELDVDAAWEALYTETMGCNQVVRCPARRPTGRTYAYMSESRRRVRRCRPCTRHASVLTSAGRARESRGPPPPSGVEAGSHSNQIRKNDFRNACRLQLIPRRVPMTEHLLVGIGPHELVFSGRERIRHHHRVLATARMMEAKCVPEFVRGEPLQVREVGRNPDPTVLVLAKVVRVRRTVDDGMCSRHRAGVDDGPHVVTRRVRIPDDGETLLVVRLLAREVVPSLDLRTLLEREARRPMPRLVLLASSQEE